MRQIGRAASQGLISLDPNEPSTAQQHPEVDIATEPLPPPRSDPIALESHIAFRSMTAIDRDQLQTPRNTYTDAGETCPPESYFDVGAWVDDRPVFVQIGDVRRKLMGEFDIPDQSRVIELARVYIAFGFGVEARAVLDDLAEPGPDVTALRYLAAMLDDDPIARKSPYARMTECNNPVALWALLGASPPPQKRSVNFGAVTRSYSALPPDLRHVLGPKLVSRLIAIGAPDVAQSIRAALARVSVEDKSALNVVDVHLAHDVGTKETGATLEKLAQRNAPDAVEALLMLIDQELEDRRVVPDVQIEQALALAFELSGGTEAPALLRAATLGYASQGNFDAAFAASSEWPQAIDPETQAETRARLLTMFVEQPDDALFLRLYFAQREPISTAATDGSLRTALANRLVGLGMADAATELLKSADELTKTDKLLLARAALAGLDPAAGLAHLRGVDGSAADSLRGDALSRLGRHDDARMAYLRAGDEEKARAEAWHIGDWNTLHQYGDPIEKNFIDRFSPPEDIESEGETGPINAAKSLLAASEEERKALHDMLERFEISGAGN
ncbi:hypothetical protein TP2_06385 [Thioclava pacifica DSM 10166]|uniref:Uncharacterized protein n=1 Tax=Thioclava pacifica DSM 10166 TaxID=1353537 RepID=A0A074JF96_9RHOB|nr:hypothetical protein TP2_06385 [Thioclava pacifica DSM 10166]